MSLTSFIGNNTFLIGFLAVGGFVVWKYIIEPRMNEGKSIEPTEEDLKTFGEKMQDNLDTSVNF